MHSLNWNPNAGHLSISEPLLSALSYPHALILVRDGETGLVLYQEGDPRAGDVRVRKVNYPSRAMPRLSIGPAPAVELGLRAGRYRAFVDEMLAERDATDPKDFII